MHIPVLLKEVINGLNLEKGKFIIDGTLDGGGHAEEVIKGIMPGGMFMGIDLDADILATTAKEKFAHFPEFKDKMLFLHGNYKEIPSFLKNRDLPKGDGLLLDLGFSSLQLEESERGFSFLKDEVLDMRYDKTQGMPAYQIISSFDEKSLSDIFWKYGEERFSRQIAKRIVQDRKNNQLSRVSNLVETIGKAVPEFYRRRKISPATKVFQALRIYVNDEFGNLESVLSSLPLILKTKGRCAVITFHSLEDRIVKNIFSGLAKEGVLKLINKKVIKPSYEESRENPRSRSAKLRIIELLSDQGTENGE